MFFRKISNIFQELEHYSIKNLKCIPVAECLTVFHGIGAAIDRIRTDFVAVGLVRINVDVAV